MIDSKDLDPNFKYEVAAEIGGANITRCFACGTCTTGCPIREVDEKYNPRQIIRKVLLGLKEQVLKSEFIWLCSGCYNCYERCPQDVKLTEVMNVLKNMAVRKGYIPEALKASVDQLEKYGRLLEISDFENTVRMKNQIPELKPSIVEIKEVLKKAGTRTAIGGAPK